jgi:hypothetical protein
MISIIISSANPEQLQKVKVNIGKTIGVPFEIISYDNSNGKNGISKVYNDGVKSAKYDILCFMHEDIITHTNDWGKLLIKYFSEYKNLGVLGIAGSDGKTSVPSGCHIVYGNYYMNLIQHYKFQETPPKRICLPENYHNSKELHQVICIDGVWFCCAKQTALENPFDEQLSGFHGYDIDFSLNISSKFTNMITFEILISHYSEGNFSLQWLDAMIYIHNKYKKSLPMYPGNATNIPIKVVEKHTYKMLIRKYVKEININFSKAIEILKSSEIIEKNPLIFIQLWLFTLKVMILKEMKRVG